MRRESPELFGDGEYMALEVSGDRKNNLFAFVRKQGAEVAITIAPRLYAKITPADGLLMPTPETWENTSIFLPEALAGPTTATSSPAKE